MRGCEHGAAIEPHAQTLFITHLNQQSGGKTKEKQRQHIGLQLGTNSDMRVKSEAMIAYYCAQVALENENKRPEGTIVRRTIHRATLRISMQTRESFTEQRSTTNNDILSHWSVLPTIRSQTKHAYTRSAEESA